MLIYATESNLSDWTDTATPVNAVQLLRSASGLVAEATQTDFYDTDDTGLPTDPLVLQAFNDATCAQVAMWIAAGIDPSAVGLNQKGLIASKKIGSAVISYDNNGPASVSVTQARQAAATSLCDESMRILHAQGLASTQVWSRG